MGNLTDAQTAFDPWRWSYNHKRPHEALDMACPASRYEPSSRSLPSVFKGPLYPSASTLEKVNYKGYIGPYRASCAKKAPVLLDRDDNTGLLAGGVFAP